MIGYQPGTEAVPIRKGGDRGKLIRIQDAPGRDMGFNGDMCAMTPRSDSAGFESLTLFHEFRNRLDQMLAQAKQQYQPWMQCKAGCFSCCRNDFRISVVEGVLLRRAIQALPPLTQSRIRDNLTAAASQPSGGWCPLLVEGACSVYTDRPILCRIFGFPVSDGETVATCELNFQEAPQMLLTAHGFDTRILAESLHVLSRLYLQEIGEPLPAPGHLPPMATIGALLGGETRGMPAGPDAACLHRA